MVEKEGISQEKVEHTGLFDFPGFYTYAHNWFLDERYNGVDEIEYIEKVIGNSKSVSFKWKAYKKVTDYFKIEQEIQCRIDDMTDVEVEIDGTKRKMNKGKMEIKFKGTLVMDYDSRWETTAFYKFLREVYNKYVIPSR